MNALAKSYGWVPLSEDPERLFQHQGGAGRKLRRIPMGCLDAINPKPGMGRLMRMARQWQSIHPQLAHSAA